MGESVGSIILGSSDSGESPQSRVEIARDDILNEFRNISIADGFRTDVASIVKAIRPIAQITEFPEVGIHIGTRTITPADQSWYVSESVCDIYIQGAVESEANMDKSADNLIDAVEALAHDFQKVMSVMMTKYINATTGRWNLLNKNYKITTFTDFGKQKNKGIVLLEFQVQLRSMDGNYD